MNKDSMLSKIVRVTDWRINVGRDGLQLMRQTLLWPLNMRLKLSLCSSESSAVDRISFEGWQPR
jgi:hypothetical protein